MNRIALPSSHAAASNELAMSCRPRVLICVDWFDPGYRAGGPIRSCVNLIDLMHDQIEFAVLTGDRDLGADTSYSNVEIGVWTTWNDKAKIRYATTWHQYAGAFLDAVRRHRPEAIYLNSMFSVSGTMIPLMMQSLRQQPKIVLAPRGMLKPSALAIRKGRKSAWLRFLKSTGLSRKILFHATSNEEADEIRAVFGSDVSLFVASNIPCKPDDQLTLKDKKPGELKLTLVGRVHPIKNVAFAINVLKDLSFQCSLDVIGPIEDVVYHAECLQAITQLGENVSVRFCGALSNKESTLLVQNSDAMFLPTLGENFGHAIFESLAVGVPVLISDQTYWRKLTAENAGWDLPLDQPDQFRMVIEQLGAMGAKEYQAWQQGANRKAMRFFEQNDLKRLYMEMFRAVSSIESKSSTVGVRGWNKL